MPKDAFGLDMPSETPGDDPFADAPEIEDVAEAVAAPEEEPAGDGKDPLAPEEESDPALDEAAEETPAEEPEEEAEEPEEEEPEEAKATPYEGRYSTKYKTVEDFEEAHRNALDLGQRQAERAKTAEEQLAQATAYLEAAAQYITQIEAEKNKPAEEDLSQTAIQLGVDEETLKLARQIAQQEAEARISPLQAQLQQQQQMAEMAKTEAETKAAIGAFRAANPDIDGESELGMVEVFHEFGLDPTLPENYSIALELSQQPDMRSVLRANPNYIETDDGLALARRLAGVKTVTRTKSKPRDLTDARKKATVESGSLGAPPAGEEPERDEWDDVLDVARGGRAKSVFGV